MSINHSVQQCEINSGQTRRQLLKEFRSILGFCAINSLFSSGTERAEAADRSFEMIDPSLGTIIDRGGNPSAPHTVLYIPDMHISDQAVDNRQARAAQLQIYALLEQISRYKTIALVLENFPDLSFEEYMALLTRSDPQNRPEGMDLLLRLYGMSNEPERIGYALNLLQDSSIGAGLLFAASYRDRCQVVGMHMMSPEQIARQVLQDEVNMNSLEQITAHPETISCASFGGSERMTLGHAIERFFHGPVSPDVARCFCELRVRANAALQQYDTHRFVDAPEREVQAAINAGTECSVIVSGLAHGFATRSLLRKASVKYAVVSPNAIETEARAALQEKPPVHVWPDNDNSDCKHIQMTSE